MVPAGKDLVGLHSKLYVQVAGRSAVAACIALPGQADLHLVLHAGRNIHHDLAMPPFTRRPTAVGAWVGYNGPLPVALGTRAHLCELPKDAALDPPDLARAVAMSALLRGGPRL